jgi:two-component system, NarL family, nitrate/nitrite response regulator NarL
MGSLVLSGDHLVFLDALSTVLRRQGHQVEVAVGGATGLTEAVRQQRPDACVISLGLAARGCAELIQRIRAASGGTSVLVVSGHADHRAVLHALEAGAVGYFHKSRGALALVAGIEQVLRGEIIVDVPRAVSPRRPGRADNQHRPVSRLTARELECLAMLVEGLDTAAMVARLGVGRTTVRTHIQAVLTKLGVHSRLEAASVAVRYGLQGGWPVENLRQYPRGQAI